jgi:ATP-dependent DNA ligase
MISPLKVSHPMAKALFFEPMLCETAEQPPEGAEWRYELKLDGYRAIGFKIEGQAQLWSRNGKDFVRRFPEVAKAIASLPEDTAIDGEIRSARRRRQAVIRSASGFRYRCDTGRVLRLRPADAAR